ncbi:MAG: nitrite reductase, copper-containing [Chloroflexi bacterium]|nr:nitrite reductase, copper-containing [Chloroflexota bacterium]
MMNGKSLNPNLAAAVLVGIAVLILAALPVRIELRRVTAENETDVAAPASDLAHDTHMTAAGAETQLVEYTVRTVIGLTPAMAFQGVGGTIDGQINPLLTASVGDTVRITVVNGDPVLHDLTISVLNLTTGQLIQDEQQSVIEFVASEPGEYVYSCSVPGHHEIGMWGTLRIDGPASVDGAGDQAAAPQEAAAAQTSATIAPAAADAVSVVRDPADMPAPIGDRGPTNVRIDPSTVEVTGILADGTTFSYFTFDGQVPGPMLRVRQGDTVEMHIHNDAGSLFPHSIDLHSVTGPGGGAVYTQTMPGAETVFTFKALNAGLYVYHCATPSIPHHISSGMYGLILVEPPGGLPPVDREFYVMQGDIYTEYPYGAQGHQTFSMDHMSHEDADYLVFNGAAGGLTSDEHALRASVGETVRIFFGVGGPNYTSSLHMIGEIFDRVYDQASITSAPLTDVQTTMVPSGGATVVEFQVDVPGRYILVDHSLSRMERGLAAFMLVDGENHPEIFYGETVTEGSGH